MTGVNPLETDWPDWPTETIASDELVALHRRLLLVRSVGERAGAMARRAGPTTTDPWIGREASTVGACHPLLDVDTVVATRAGPRHRLARGLDPGVALAELAQGPCPSLRPDRLLLAVGAAAASRQRSDGGIAVAVVSPRDLLAGPSHEALGLIAAWSLPVVVWCEVDDVVDIRTVAGRHPVTLRQRTTAHGFDHLAVDGSDVVACVEAMQRAAAQVRDGGPTVFAEVRTHHPDRDPVAAHRARLVVAGVEPAKIDEVAEQVRSQIDARSAVARRDPIIPSPASSRRVSNGSADGTAASIGEPEPLLDGAPRWRTADAIREALAQELTEDPDVLVITTSDGSDPAHGLQERFGDRVRLAPISDDVALGFGIGAAQAGLRVVVGLRDLHAAASVLDARLDGAEPAGDGRGGRPPLALTVRARSGAGAVPAVPGTTVVAPSSPADTYGLLRAAIRDPNPVVVVEDFGRYDAKGPRPPADHLVPIGRAAVLRPGSDVTVVAASSTVAEALTAADEVAAEKISVEVIDLRTVAPLDLDPVLESVRRTSRLLVAQDAAWPDVVGAEVVAAVAHAAFWHLDAPIERLGAVAGGSPDRDDIAVAIRRLHAV